MSWSFVLFWLVETPFKFSPICYRTRYPRIQDSRIYPWRIQRFNCRQRCYWFIHKFVAEYFSLIRDFSSSRASKGAFSMRNGRVIFETVRNTSVLEFVENVDCREVVEVSDNKSWILKEEAPLDFPPGTRPSDKIIFKGKKDTKLGADWGYR